VIDIINSPIEEMLGDVKKYKKMSEDVKGYEKMTERSFSLSLLKLRLYGS